MTQEINDQFYDQIENLDDVHYQGRLPYIKNIPTGEQRTLKCNKIIQQTQTLPGVHPVRIGGTG
jgi:hypothetical protein